ncbi:DUF4136 domain-containing protein [Polymorphobacter sp.]|uniref:DUF4136 domain-containing protein n=1 Tax=Polymorphobacter sp. TaxID=1909290 RepID=UPI003F72462B
MIKFSTAVLPIVALATLAGCAPSFEARVSRFQQMPPPSAQTFFIEPKDKENVGGLEFATYANHVRQRLLANGYTEAVTPEQAALTVMLDYTVGPPREAVRSRPGWGGGMMGPGWGGWGWNPYWGGRGWGGAGWGGWGGGWGGGGWGAPEVYSVTQYNSAVALKIVRQSDKASVFEGRAETVSTSNNLTRMVPNLVTAIFTNFPGNTGETVRVKFDPTRPDVAPTVRPGR